MTYYDNGTFILENPTIREGAIFDVAHFCVSVLYTYPVGRTKPGDRKINLKEISSIPYEKGSAKEAAKITLERTLPGIV